MLNFSSHLQWFQAKIGSYDKQIWETSVEQRILQGLENRPKREGSLHKELIDIDLVRGSTFSKAKPRHGLKSVIFNGLKRVIFFPHFFTQWQDHFNKAVVYFFMFHYIIQLIQLTLYFMWSDSTETMLEEIFLPIVLALSLGVLHAHIIAPYTVKQRRKKTYSTSNSKTKSTLKTDSGGSILSALSRPHTAENIVHCLSPDVTVPASNDVCTYDLTQTSQDNTASNRSQKKSVLFTPSTLISDEPSDEELGNINAEKVGPEGYDGETETKDSSSSESKDVLTKSVEEDPAGALRQDTVNDACIKMKPHLRRFSQTEVVAVTDKEDLKKFITAKYKHIPDPTPIHSAKKEKDKSLCKCPASKKMSKNRSQLSESVGNSLANVSPSDVLCQSLPVPVDRCSSNKPAVIESLDDTGDYAAVNGAAAFRDTVTDDSNSDQKSSNSAIQTLVSKAESIMNVFLPVSERRSSHSVSQPHTPINHDGNKYRHHIEVRMIASADASPTPSRKTSTHYTLLTPLNAEVQSTPIVQHAARSPRSQQPSPVTPDSKNNLNVLDLNEDTITKSHKKREEYKQLFVKMAQASLVEKTTTTSSSRITGPDSKHLMLKRRHRDDHKLISGEIFQKNKQCKEIVQWMSETEYDRINSDVNSSGHSTSDDEDVCTNVEPTKSLIGDQDQCDVKNDVCEDQEHDEIRAGPVSNNENGTFAEDIHRAVLHDNVPYPSMAQDDPFILWYKEAHAPGSLHGMSGSVSCYIWEGEELKKTNLSLLDIGWSIIQAVERHEQGKIYSIFGFFVVIVLCFTPLFFRMYANRANLVTAVEMTRHSDVVEGTFLNSFIVTATTNTSVTVVNDSLGNMTTNDHVNSLANDIVPIVLASILASEWPARCIIMLGIVLRLALYTMTFLMLCVAENSFEQRLQYAKHFCRLTSSRRARKYHLPHFRLNKLANIKCWLSLRSYLKKSGPQRSVESIISSAFYMLLTMLSLVCVNLLQSADNHFINRLINWDLTLCSVALGIFMMRFLVLGTKITKKYRNRSVIITEQINLFLAMQTRPHKKEELTLAHNVLRLAESLLKEVEGPFKICGWSMNPFLYNILKVVILSVFSTILSETCGFKMKLYKIKINPANW